MSCKVSNRLTYEWPISLCSAVSALQKKRAQNHSCAKGPLWLWHAAGWCKTGLTFPSNENTSLYTGWSPFHYTLFHVPRALLDQQTSCSCSGNFTASVHPSSVFRLLVLDLLLCSHESQQGTWTKPTFVNFKTLGTARNKKKGWGGGGL